MTTFPRINTSLSFERSRTTFYGPYPPSHLSNSANFVKIPLRINPLQPSPPKRRINTSWETGDQHWHNEQRKIWMKQREHYRYHSAWAKAFYGSPAEKESYRKHFRDVLKQQMADGDNYKRQNQIDRAKESVVALAYDRKCLSDDVNKLVQQYKYLRKFRDDNKKLMEQQWNFTKVNRMLEEKYDQETLQYNPINWSSTLK